jgi:hypothetical protein
VRTNERACPFCKGALPEALPVVPSASNRLTRAAAFAFTASLATSALTTAASCGGESTPVGEHDSGNFQPPYGIAPPVDAGHDANAGGDADASSNADADADADADAGGQALYGAPAYGIPPPPDSGEG